MYSKPQGPVKSFELLTADLAEGMKRRIYRAAFESGLKVRINFAIDARQNRRRQCQAGIGNRHSSIRSDIKKVS